MRFTCSYTTDDGVVLYSREIVDIPEDLLASYDAKQDRWEADVKRAAGYGLTVASKLMKEKT